MNEKETIRKLRLLQEVFPDTRTLHVLKGEIFEEIGFGKRFGLERFLSFSSFRLRFVLAAVVVFFVVSLVIFSTDMISRVTISAEIFFAPDQFHKAQLALGYAESQFNNSSSNITSRSQSLTLANTEMSELTLVGEKGKYTMQQCLALYNQYHTYLETMKKVVNSDISSSQDKQGNAVFLSKVKQYDEQAEKRLHKYKE
jgi:hypothetical protein